MAHPGPAIRAMREAQDLTLRQLSELSGVSYGHLGLIEREERMPSTRVLRDIEQALADNLAGDAA